MFLCRLFRLCPFLGVWFSENVAAVDVSAFCFEEGGADTEAETAGSACDDDGFSSEGEEVECWYVGER